MSVPVGLALVWVVSGIAAVILLVQETRRLLKKPLTDTDLYCARVDQEITRHEALVEARLQAIDKCALLEDIEVRRP